MADVLNFTVKTAEEHRDDMLRTIRVYLVRNGVANPNVGPTSDFYARAQALANELEVAGANCIIKLDELMPDTAGDTGLGRWGNILGRQIQPATGSYGNVTLSSSASTTITAGATLTDDIGQKFEATTSGIYANGAPVPVRAIDVGFATNHAAGDTLTWVTAPPFADDKAIVATGGLVNGTDAEDRETYRSAIISFFQNPPQSGNREHIAEFAEASSNSVQKAFVYPCAQGPSTVHVACAAAPTSTSKERDIDATLLNTVVKPYVIGQYAEHAEVTVTTVDNENADIAFALNIPNAPTATPPGPGGGWLDATPWPPSSTANGGADVMAVTSSTVFDVRSVPAPTVGATRVSWLSTTDWKVKTATVTASSVVANGYRITIDQPFVGIAVGALVWPACESGQTYADAVLAQFALMGPGEKTANAALLSRAYRYPTPQISWPYALGPELLRALADSGSEVASVNYVQRNATLGAAGTVNPTVPGTITDSPSVFIPRHISFYPPQ